MSTAAKKSLFAVLGSTQAASLHPSEKLILVYLSWRQGRNGAAWPSLDKIAGDLRIDRRLCRRSIDRLCAAGCIEKTSGHRGRGYSNQYAVLLDKRGQDTPISDGPKGGKEPPLECEKRGYISQKKGAGNPLKEQEKEPIESNALRTSSARTNARKQNPKAKTAKPAAGQPFIPPTIEQVQEYATSRGYPGFDAQKFIDYYAAADWYDSKGNPVSNWKQKFISVWEQNAKTNREPECDGYTEFGTHPATDEDIKRLEGAGVL